MPMTYNRQAMVAQAHRGKLHVYGEAPGGSFLPPG